MSGAARFEHQRIAVRKQRRVAQLDGDHQRPVQPDEHRHLDEDRQAAAQRIVVVLAEQFLLGLGAGLDVVLVLLLELLDLRLQHLHLLLADDLLAAQAGTCSRGPARSAG